MAVDTLILSPQPGTQFPTWDFRGANGEKSRVQALKCHRTN